MIRMAFTRRAPASYNVIPIRRMGLVRMNGFDKRMRPGRPNKGFIWSLVLIALGAGVVLSLVFPAWLLAAVGGVILFLIGVLLLLC